MYGASQGLADDEDEAVEEFIDGADADNPDVWLEAEAGGVSPSAAPLVAVKIVVRTRGAIASKLLWSQGTDKEGFKNSEIFKKATKRRMGGSEALRAMAEGDRLYTKL